MDLLKIKVTKKENILGQRYEQLTLSFKIPEGETKFDVMKRFKITSDDKSQNVRRGLNELANELSPSNSWVLIRPANGGYQYMRFFPKNNPTKFSFYFQGPTYDSMITTQQGV